MWLFTVDGMFGIVLARGEEGARDPEIETDYVEISARRRGHLERLCQRYTIAGEVRKVRGSGAPYRLKMPKRDFASIASRMVCDLNYASFKQAAQETRKANGRGSGYIQLLDQIAKDATARLRS